MEVRTPESYIIAALDVPTAREAVNLVKAYGWNVGMYKIGPVLFYGSSRLTWISEDEEDAYIELGALTDGELMLDLKLHEVKDVMGKASLALLAGLRPSLFTVHASSGLAALKSAVANKGDMEPVAVTVLTSLTPEECREIYGDWPSMVVPRMARMAYAAGIRYLVCSPKELPALRAIEELSDMKIITPGIRQPWVSDPRGQSRFAPIEDAIRDGAYAGVIGSPLYDPPAEVGTPADAAKRLHDDVAQYLGQV